MSSVAIQDYEKLLNMIMEANKYIRYAAICDHDTKILWQSMRDGVSNILSHDETKSLLKRAVDNWQVREGISPKVGRGRYAIVGYEKIKRITIPLDSNHLLFLSVEGSKPEYIKDITKIIEFVEQHPSTK
ncbi:MAG: hypothetical protein XU09_C0008G0322 [Thaumarchaeota archaeon CSP1-1]|nr:MAG: hypothetical protein XU09_C0008G0322 [Thaumarchaeota archaeon CSP1-1]